MTQGKPQRTLSRRQWLRGALTVSVLGLSLRTALTADTTGKSQLLGAWRLISGDLEVRFEEDGTFEARTPEGVTEGRWQQLDEMHLATWADENKPRRVNRFEVQGDNLIIIDDHGQYHVHKRLPAN